MNRRLHRVGKRYDRGRAYREKIKEILERREIEVLNEDKVLDYCERMGKASKVQREIDKLMKEYRRLRGEIEAREREIAEVVSSARERYARGEISLSEARREWARAGGLARGLAPMRHEARRILGRVGLLTAKRNRILRGEE